jgi:hypothetical protein
MKDSLFFESPPLDADSRGQPLGQSGRWFRQDGRIVVLLDDQAQPEDGETRGLSAGGVPSRKDLIDPSAVRKAAMENMLRAQCMP